MLTQTLSRPQAARTGEAGFTLVEAVIVMVLIGILAAVALPRYLDYGAEARLRALQTAASSISAAATSNYTLRKAGAGVAVTTCTAAAALATYDPAMSVTAVSGALSAGVVGQCNINFTGSDAVSGGVTFSVVGA